jgi:Poly A polymerase head domain
LLDDAKRRDFTINCLYYKRQQEAARGSKRQQEAENIEFNPEKYVKQ